MREINDISVTGKTVLLRVDLNVPIDEGKILDKFRLIAVLPTINYLINRGAKVVLLSHLGRPGGQVDTELSLKPIILQLSALLKKKIFFAPSPESAELKSHIAKMNNAEIVALENLRFFKGEENNSRTFAKTLATLGEIYVNDAFAVTHREAASTVAITEFLPSYAGLLLEKEIHMLKGLLRRPAQPFTVIIGGAKIKDKLPMIEHLIPYANKILLGGGIANTFAAANGQDVKNSICESTHFDLAIKLQKKAKGKIVVPSDFIWQDDVIKDIGAKTLAQYQSVIKNSQTIFWNGNLGVSEEGYQSSRTIAVEIANSKATSIAGGGNTVETLHDAGVQKEFTFVSTGGGATLELLSGRRLPGVEALG